MTRTRRLTALVLLVTLVAGLAGDVAAAGPTDDAPLGRAERVLVYSVPTLSWSDLEEFDAPNLEALLADSVVADLSVRSVTQRTDAVDGYATLNAGTRTEGTTSAVLAFVAGLARSGVSDQDGDPVEVPPGALDPDESSDEVPDPVLSNPEATQPDPTSTSPALEDYEGSPAAEEFAWRTGVLPAVGEVFNFGLVSMRRLNEKMLFGSEVGALGTALDAHGVGRAVVANADRGQDADDVEFRREASVAMIDRNGLVSHGRVGRTLLEAHSGSPYGTRYDNAEVAASFEEFWRPNSVVLVEASDLARYESAIPLVLESQRERLKAQAIERSDELLGRLLESVDLERDAVVVVAPYATGESTALTVAAVHAPEVEPGLLSSGTTRRAGFVQTVDIAPSILSLVGATPPSSMEGTLMERKGSGGDDLDARRTFLIEADAGAKFRDGVLGLASTSFVVAQLVLWGLALLVFKLGRHRLRVVSEIAALGVLVFLPMTFAAGAFPFHRWGAGAYWAFVLVSSVVVSTAIYLATRRHLVDPLIATLGFIVVFLSVDIVIGGPLQFNTIFGYTPTVAGRFNGMGNPAFSMFAAAAIILAALLAHRIGGRRGTWVAIGLLAWAVLLDGSPFWGADVGGALALVPSAGVTAWMLLGVRIKLRTAALWAAGTVAVVTVFGLVDMNRPAAKRSHLGRLFADIGDNGWEAFQTVVLRKLNANLSVLSSSVWTLMLPLVFAFVGLMFWWAPWRLRQIERRIPEERAALAGLLTAMVLGFALNDSGISVPGMMIGVANASLVHLLLRVGDDEVELTDAELTDEERTDAVLADSAAGDGVAGGDQVPAAQS